MLEIELPENPGILIHNVDQNTPEWHAKRAGIPSASEFSRMIDSQGKASVSRKDYAALLAAEKYAGKPLENFAGNIHTRRGTELEPAAGASYEMLTGQEIEKVGFVTDPDEQYGCSPDGFVGSDGLVEFKCQKTEQHIKTLMYFRQHGKCPTTYVPQTQGQLFVTGRAWNDLMFYHPELPPLIIRQYPDEDIFKGIRQQLDYVLAERDRVLEILREF